MSFLPATPNLERRLRLFANTAPTDDIREGGSVLLVAGLLTPSVAPGILGFASEATNPALAGDGSFTEPVFGDGGGAAGGPFAVDVHPPGSPQLGNSSVNGGQLIAVAHPGATFLMDFALAGVQIEPTFANAMGLPFAIAIDPDNGAAYVVSDAPGTTVQVVDIKASNYDTGADPGPGITGAKFGRVEVVVLTPQLGG